MGRGLAGTKKRTLSLPLTGEADYSWAKVDEAVTALGAHGQRVFGADLDATGNTIACCITGTTIAIDEAITKRVQF